MLGNIAAGHDRYMAEFDSMSQQAWASSAEVQDIVGYDMMSAEQVHELAKNAFNIKVNIAREKAKNREAAQAGLVSTQTGYLTPDGKVLVGEAQVQEWLKTNNVVASAEEAASAQGTQNGGGDENKNSSNLVLDKKDVKKATSSGVPTPDFYFENNGKKDYYVKPEDNGEAIVVKPGQVYIGRIDGFATEELGVYKVPDFTRVTVAPEGYLIFTRSWLMGAVHRVLNKNIERVDQNWLQDRHNNNDYGWDKLFNSIR